MLVVFALALAADRAAARGRARLALAGVGGAVIVVATGLTLRAPLPDTLEEVRARPGIAFVCPLAPRTHTEPSARGARGHASRAERAGSHTERQLL
jgi:hypothetical protein